MNPMKKIILDTNFLMMPAQLRVDVFEEVRRICNFEHEIAVLDRTIEELNIIIKEQKGADRAAAKLALALVKAKKVKVIKTEEKKSVDKILADFSAQGCIIATQDRELKRKLKKPIIILRQKKYLMLVQ